MAVFRAILVALVGLSRALSLDLNSPNYTADGIVNSADNRPGPLAPNTIASLYGVRLSYVTRGLTPDDIRGGLLPTVLPGTGVRVLVGNMPAGIYYVSATQINFLVPANLLPGPSTVQVVLDAHSGPLVKIMLQSASPELFQLDAQHAVAVRPDGSPITPDSPAHPGDIAILYATGLGQTVPPIPYGQICTEAAPLNQMSDFKLLLDGTKASEEYVQYAGVAPGFAGLYQLNILLPKSIQPNPEIRIGLGDAMSITGLHLPVDQ